MFPPLSFSRIFQTGLSQLYRRGEPVLDTPNYDWKHPQKKSLLHVPMPVEGCPINSLPPEILSHIFVLGHQADLDPEPSRYATEPGPDSGLEHSDPAHARDDPVAQSALSDRGVDKALPPEPIPIVDDDRDNSDWEDEDSDNDASSMSSIFVDSSFQVTVSHVCKRWREVALETPSLWSEIDLMTGRHAESSYRRASTYLSRSKGYPISVDIEVDECDTDDGSVYSERSDYQLPDTTVQFQEALNLLLPHVGRWRKFKLVAESYLYFHAALSQLSSSPPALLLESLELHHLDEEPEPDHLSFPRPSYKTPFVLFDNHAPRLQHASFCGVHIDWNSTTFLKNLHYLELAYHSQDVRPSFDAFFTVLRSSPGLRTLDLCMSGPWEPPHEWPTFLPPPPQDDHYHDPHIPTSFNAQSRALDEHMILPKLHELRLAYQAPDDLAAFFNRVSMPALHTLGIEFTDYEFTEFIRNYLIAPPKWQGSSSRESRLTNLKELKIAQLPCTPEAIAELYAMLVNLETIELDFRTLDDPFWEVLVPMRINGVTTPANQLLPALRTMKVMGSYFNVLRQIVDARTGVGLPLKRLCIDYDSQVDRDDDLWLRSKVEGVEYFEVSDEEDFTDDDESVSSIIEVEMDGFPL